jgi:hypothetical protein
MSKRIFTKKQLHLLSNHKDIIRCSIKSVTFSKTFKIKAVKKYQGGLSSREIFERAGLDLRIIGKDIPRESIRRWKRIYEEKGARGFSKAPSKNKKARKKSRKINLDNLTDTERIKYLETEVAYLKAKNDFLVKFRAKRAESNSGLNINMKSSIDLK